MEKDESSTPPPRPTPPPTPPPKRIIKEGADPKKPSK